MLGMAVWRSKACPGPLKVLLGAFSGTDCWGLWEKNNWKVRFRSSPAAAVRVPRL